MSNVIKAGYLQEQTTILNGFDVTVQPTPANPARGLVHARRKAAALLTAAEEEAERLFSEAKREGHALGLHEGMEQGRADGYDEGFAAAMQEAQDALEAMQSALAAAKRAKAEVLATLNQEAVELALAVAEKIVHKTIVDDSGYLPRLVQEVVSQITEPGEITVRIGANAPHEQSVTLLKRLSNSIQIHIDESLVAGDCVIETEAGLFDARLETRLAYIRQALAGVEM